MTFTYLIPIYPPDEIIVLDWDDNVETTMLLALGFLVLMQLILLVYIVLEHFQQCAFYRQQLNEGHRRRYANFVFRRLLAQLDKALMQRPGAGQELSFCLEAKSRAQSAIRLFCRDTSKVLYPEHDLDSLAASDAYFVLDDEEAELNSAGYASVDFDVTDAFLESLMYPKRADIPSRVLTKS